MKRSMAPRLTDIIEASERIIALTSNLTLQAFKSNWQLQWTVERGVEIVSEASRHLTDELKLRHPEIPWKKIAGIGNVIRHDYKNVAPAVLWDLAGKHLAQLEVVCREELVVAQADEE